MPTLFFHKCLGEGAAKYRRQMNLLFSAIKEKEVAYLKNIDIKTKIEIKPVDQNLIQTCNVDLKVILISNRGVCNTIYE